MEASGDQDRSSRPRLLRHCRQTWRLGSERRIGGPDVNVMGRFKRAYWRDVGKTRRITDCNLKLDPIRQSEQKPHLKHIHE